MQFAPERAYRNAWLALNRGDLAAAAAQAQRGLRTFPSAESPWHWRFSILKAEVVLRQGVAEEALALDAPDLPASLAASDLAVWRKLTQGAASAYLLRFAESDRDLQQAEALARQGYPVLLGEVKLRQGTLASLQGDVRAAEAYYRETLHLAREQKNAFLETAALGSLGLIATKQEHYDQAIEWNRAALQLSEAVGARSSSARIVGNMAWSYRELGDFDNALASYQLAENASATAGLVGNQIYWLTGIASVYYRQHDYSAAQATSERALTLARGIAATQTIIECLNDLSNVALETGRLDAARSYNNEARAREAAAPDPIEILDSALIQGRLALSAGNLTAAEERFQEVIHDPKAGRAQKWEAEARLARGYADHGENAKAEKEFRDSLGTIESVRSSVQAEDLRLSFLSSAIAFYDDYIEFLIAQQRSGDALQVAELSRARTLAEGLGSAPKTISFPMRDFHPEQTARRLHAALLFYWLGQKRSYLWVITPAKVTCLTLASATEIDPLVKSYRGAVLSGRDVLESVVPDGETLYTLLIEPAKELIPAGSRVILIPDGSLYGLNFETLLVPGPIPHFWIEDVTIAMASSLALLPSATHSGPKDSTLLLVGNAVSATSDFPALRQAGAEMDRVEHYFGASRSEVLSGAQATPAAFLQRQPEKFAYLHFVTHGTASRAHPLDSAVILSPEGDSYKLYARDIVKHPLSAYLVTVSACNGSGTRAYSGEGLVGLSWAFLRAGAHNVIAALWEVNDVSTPQLMDKLYSELRQGQDPAAALRAAKLSLLHSDSVFAKPFYWAPFQLYAGS